MRINTGPGGGSADSGEEEVGNDDPDTGSTRTDRLRDDAESDPMNGQTEETDVGSPGPQERERVERERERASDDDSGGSSNGGSDSGDSGSTGGVPEDMGDERRPSGDSTDDNGGGSSGGSSSSGGSGQNDRGGERVTDTASDPTEAQIENARQVAESQTGPGEEVVMKSTSRGAQEAYIVSKSSDNSGGGADVSGTDLNAGDPDTGLTRGESGRMDAEVVGDTATDPTEEQVDHLTNIARDRANGRDYHIARTPSGAAVAYVGEDAEEAASTSSRRAAAEQFEQQAEERFGQDITPGEDFTVQQTDEGFQREFSEEFRRQQALQESEEELEAATGQDLTPGEDFTVELTDDGYTREITDEYKTEQIEQDLEERLGQDLTAGEDFTTEEVTVPGHSPTAAERARARQKREALGDEAAWDYLEETTSEQTATYGTLTDEFQRELQEESATVSPDARTRQQMGIGEQQATPGQRDSTTETTETTGSTTRSTGGGTGLGEYLSGLSADQVIEGAQNPAQTTGRGYDQVAGALDRSVGTTDERMGPGIDVLLGSTDEAVGRAVDSASKGDWAGVGDALAGSTDEAFGRAVQAAGEGDVAGVLDASAGGLDEATGRAVKQVAPVADHLAGSTDEAVGRAGKELEQGNVAGAGDELAGDLDEEASNVVSGGKQAASELASGNFAAAGDIAAGRTDESVGRITSTMAQDLNPNTPPATDSAVELGNVVGDELLGSVDDSYAGGFHEEEVTEATTDDSTGFLNESEERDLAEASAAYQDGVDELGWRAQAGLDYFDPGEGQGAAGKLGRGATGILGLGNVFAGAGAAETGTEAAANLDSENANEISQSALSIGAGIPGAVYGEATTNPYQFAGEAAASAGVGAAAGKAIQGTRLSTGRTGSALQKMDFDPHRRVSGVTDAPSELRTGYGRGKTSVTDSTATRAGSRFEQLAGDERGQGSLAPTGRRGRESGGSDLPDEITSTNPDVGEGNRLPDAPGGANVGSSSAGSRFTRGGSSSRGRVGDLSPRRGPASQTEWADPPDAEMDAIAGTGAGTTSSGGGLATSGGLLGGTLSRQEQAQQPQVTEEAPGPGRSSDLSDAFAGGSRDGSLFGDMFASGQATTPSDLPTGEETAPTQFAGDSIFGPVSVADTGSDLATGQDMAVGALDKTRTDVDSVTGQFIGTGTPQSSDTDTGVGITPDQQVTPDTTPDTALALTPRLTPDQDVTPDPIFRQRVHPDPDPNVRPDPDPHPDPDPFLPLNSDRGRRKKRESGRPGWAQRVNQELLNPFTGR